MGKAVRGVAGVALIVVGALTEGYGGAFLVNVGVGLAFGAAAEYLAKKPQATRPSESTIEYSGTVEPRRLIYGQCRVSGMHTIPPFTTGTNNENLHQILTLAGHEVHAINGVYFNNEAIGTITAITGTANDGKVTTGDYSNKAWARRYTGASGQAVDYILDTDLLGLWTSDYYGGGIAYLALKFAADETVYKTGKPDVTCDVQGMICYDPRLDSSPGNDPGNALYRAWTENPALCTADYLTNPLGLAESVERIDWDMVADAADICDETVDVPPGSPTFATQTRYTCGLVLYATTDYRSNILELCSSMLGSCVYSGGKWRIRAGAWEAPSFEITASTVMGQMDVVTALPYKDRYNGVRGTFRDSGNNYQENEFPAVSNATYVSDDGEAVFKDIKLLSADNVYEAQRYAILVTRKSRNRQVATIPCSLDMFKVRPGDTGIVTIEELGWTDKTVRCEAWKFDPRGIVMLTVREELESDWDDPLRTDYQTPLAISNPAPTYFTPAAPSALAAVGTPRAVNLSWTAPTLVPTGSKYEVYEYTSSTPFSSATKVWEGVSTNCRLDKSDTTTRYYWVLLRTSSGVQGVEHPTSAAGVAGAAQAITVVTSDSISSVNISLDYSGLDVDAEMAAGWTAVVVASGRYSMNVVAPAGVVLAGIITDDVMSGPTADQLLAANVGNATANVKGSFSISKSFTYTGDANPTYTLILSPGYEFAALGSDIDLYDLDIVCTVHRVV